MLANGTYSVTGKFYFPHCPLVASSGTFTPTLAAASCPASSSDGVSFFDVPLASGANTLAFPTNGSAGQTFAINFTGPTSGTPTITINAGYIFPSAALSSGNVPLTGTNGLDQLECSLAPSTASYAQSGLAAWCNVANNYISTGLATPVVGNPVSTSSTTGSGGATSTVIGSLALTSGQTLVVADFGNGTSIGGGPKPAMTAPTVAAGSVGSCAQVTGAREAPSSGTIQTGAEVWQCSITGSGTGNITANWGSTLCYFCLAMAVTVQNLNASPDAGIGNSANITSNTTTPSVTSNGNGNGKNELVISDFAGGDGSFTPQSGTQTLAINGGNAWLVQALVVNSTSAITASATQTSNVANAVIAVLTP